MKHCVIRRSHFPAVMDQIIALANAGYKSRWSCTKGTDKWVNGQLKKGQWTATSVRRIAVSLDELQRAVA